MIKKILNIINYIRIFNNYVNFNKNNLKKIKSKKKTNKIILVEFFDIKASILSLSLFCNAFSIKKNYKIICYFPNFLKTKTKIKFYFNWYINTFSSTKLFKSFGMTNFILPEKKIQNKNLEIVHNKILNKIKSKKDVLKIKIEDVPLGDLIYDTYLRENDLITIDINDQKFKLFILKTIHLFYYWKNFYRENKVKAILASHSVYLTALPLRVGMKFNVDCFCVNHHAAFRLTKKKPLVWANFDDYPKIFNKLPNVIKKKGLLIAKSQLNKRFTGKKDILYNISDPLKESTFLPGKKFHKKVLKNNNNLKVLIAAHDFNDAPHLHKDLIFEDMYEWFDFLGKFSLKKNNIDWYIKLHPADYDRNLKKMNFFLNKYKKLKLLPKNVSHNQIINEGINCVLTCYGSIGHEYPFFNIPVINGGHNPHCGYNFNYNPKNKKEYSALINKIQLLKVRNNYKKQIFEFYMVRYFLDYGLFNDIHNAELFNDIKILDIFLNRYNQNNISKIIKDYSLFISSNKRRLIDLNQIK